MRIKLLKSVYLSRREIEPDTIQRGFALAGLEPPSWQAFKENLPEGAVDSDEWDRHFGNAAKNIPALAVPVNGGRFWRGGPNP